MICNYRRILCFFVSLFFFYLLTKPENRQKKSELTQEEKLSISWSHVSTSLSCSVSFSLGMLWWTAVNLYSSCKLIVRKLYRFLYFGRKVFFFSVIIKDFLSWHHIHVSCVYWLVIWHAVVEAGYLRARLIVDALVSCRWWLTGSQIGTRPPLSVKIKCCHLGLGDEIKSPIIMPRWRLFLPLDWKTSLKEPVDHTFHKDAPPPCRWLYLFWTGLIISTWTRKVCSADQPDDSALTSLYF